MVVPHQLKWHQKLLARFIYCVIRLVAFTLRFRYEYHAGLLSHHPFIFCIWHNRLSLCGLLYEDYVRTYKLPHQLAALVSASKDGAVVARVLEHFKIEPARGSSSRRGAQAMLELKTWAERGYDLAITPDGPRGPRYEVQPGAISLAQVTGLPLVPVAYHLSRKVALKSWDRFQIPLFFGRVEVHFGQPLSVPRELSEAEHERLRLELEKRLKNLTVD